MSDTTLRHLKLLSLIPRAPHAKSSRELSEALSDNGFQITQRSVQRDLNRLSELFPITCEADGKAQLWFWAPGGVSFDLPAMDLNSAVAFRMLDLHARSFLPASSLTQLEPHFQRAETVLESHTSPHADWPNRILAVPETIGLIPPAIDPEVSATVYEAVLARRALELTYWSRSKEREIEHVVYPLGLLVRDRSIVLVCTFKGYSDRRLCALHRMRGAHLAEETVPKDISAGFRLEEFVAEGHGDFSLGGSIGLQMRVSPTIATHLGEARLSPEQTIKLEDDGAFLVTATIPDTLTLRWWLLALGENVEVLSPPALAQWLSDTHRASLTPLRGLKEKREDDNAGRFEQPERVP